MSEEISNVYSKLAKARVELQNKNIKKTGKNQNFKYFELGDFLPFINEINNELGLLTIVNFKDKEHVELIISDTKQYENNKVSFYSKYVEATLHKGQAIQNLGSTQTYHRRYLYLMAYEVIEGDSVDADQPLKEAAKKGYIPTFKLPIAEIKKIESHLETLSTIGELREYWVERIKSKAGNSQVHNDILDLFHKFTHKLTESTEVKA